MSLHHFYVAPWSKAKTKKALKKIVEKKPEDPDIDFQHPTAPTCGTPEQLREFFGIVKFNVYGPRPTRWYATMIREDGKWKIT